MKKKSSSSSSFYVHSITAVAATCAFLLLPLLHGTALRSELRGGADAEIAVEYSGPLTLSIAMSTGRNASMVELSHDGTGIAHVSVPSDWELREVRGVSLSETPNDPESLGFTRYALPPNATLSFLASDPPAHLSLHNPTEIPLQVRVITVDLATDTATKNVILSKEKRVRVF